MTDIEIELCGRLADVLGALAVVRIPAQGCSAGVLFDLVGQQHPPLYTEFAKGSVKVCVNEVVVAAGAAVVPGDSIALFPPVSGG